jgi:hypothetical protein
MNQLFRTIWHAIRRFNHPWYGKLTTVALLIAIPLTIFAIRIIYYPGLPGSVKVFDVLQTNRVWTQEERQSFYHSSQGSQVMPNEWFLALEQPDSKELFLDNDYMSRFRFIPDADPLHNENLLPVGIAKDDPDPVNGVENLGLSCALCHTSLITYKGMGIRVDGAPGIFNFDTFLQQLVVAVGVTVAPALLQSVFDPGKFDRFAHRVLGDKYSKAAASKLKSEVREWVKDKVDKQGQQLLADRALHMKSTESGFGRLDALGTGGNTLYRKLTPQNLRVLNAPVKAFPLWYVAQYDWVQSNGSIRQPMARNIIESLAVNAYIALPGADIKQRYLSSVRLRQMFEMENAVSKLSAPVWPEGVLGKVDRAKAERGKALYAQYCSSCHSPKIEPAPLCGDQIAIRNKKRYFMLRLTTIDKIGTDPADALNFANRVVDASNLGLGPKASGAAVIQMVIGGVLRRGLQDLKLTQKQMDEWTGYRSDCWRAAQAYPARPLDGIWAAAPYLHNSSVPNIYQLLLPADQRDKVFYTGSTEYDPKHIGYLHNKIPGSFKVDVSLQGNSNAGHEFRNAPPGTKGVIGPELTDDQRWELVEYLKIINEMPAAMKAAAEEDATAWSQGCWTDTEWGNCKAAPIEGAPGVMP